MQKAFNILIAALMMSGAGLAQEKSESVESILQELSDYAAPVVIPDIAVEPEAPVAVVETAPDVEKESNGWKFWGKNEPSAAELTEEESLPESGVAGGEVVGMEAMTELAPAPTAGEQFAQAQQGFKDAVSPKPENVAARLYPTSRMERDHRATEIKSMTETKAAWSTDLVFRS